MTLKNLQIIYPPDLTNKTHFLLKSTSYSNRIPTITMTIQSIIYTNHFLNQPVNCHHTPQIHHHLLSLSQTVEIHSLLNQYHTQCHPNPTTTHQYQAICPTLVLCFLQLHNSHPIHFITPQPVHPTIITFLESLPQDQNIKTIP